MKTSRSTQSGFTLIEIMIVVAIIGLLAAIAVPSFVHSRSSSQLNACIENLRQIDGAKQTWGLNNNVQPTAVPDPGALRSYLGRGSAGSLPYCPVDSSQNFTNSYTVNNLQAPPTCLVVPSNHVYY